MVAPDVAAVVARWAQRGSPLVVPGAETVVWREGSGPPVVCLHGVPASAFLYRNVLPALAEHGLEGIAFDFPGLGLAQRPRNFDYRWSGLATWTVAAVDALGLDRFHLVVHDIGGPIGFEVIRRIPDRIASLTALNTFVRVAHFKRPWTMEPFARLGIGELSLRTMVPAVFERLVRWQAISAPVPSAEVRTHLALVRRVDDGRAFLRIMRGFERTEVFEARIAAALANRDFDAQVVWGERDPALPLHRHGYDVRDALRLDDIQTLPTKHFVPEDAPKEVAAAVANLAVAATRPEATGDASG